MPMFAKIRGIDENIKTMAASLATLQGAVAQLLQQQGLQLTHPATHTTPPAAADGPRQENLSDVNDPVRGASGSSEYVPEEGPSARDLAAVGVGNGGSEALVPSSKTAFMPQGDRYAFKKSPVK